MQENAHPVVQSEYKRIIFQGTIRYKKYFIHE